MDILSYSELDKMILDARFAYAYAEEHFEELKARPACYTLYGPDAYGIGAAAPAKCTKSKERVLRKNTSRKKFTVYELDENYNVLCSRIIENYSNIHCTYLHFELGDVHYARPFLHNENIFYADIVHAVKFADGKPVYYAESSCSHLVAEFYEYISDDKMIVTAYAYHPHRKFTTSGIPISKDASVGAPNSSAHIFCAEESVRYIDFSRWFS